MHTAYTQQHDDQRHQSLHLAWKRPKPKELSTQTNNQAPLQGIGNTLSPLAARASSSQVSIPKKMTTCLSFEAAQCITVWVGDLYTPIF